MNDKRPSEIRKEIAHWREAEKARPDDPEVEKTSRTDVPPNRPPKGGRKREAGYSPGEEE